MMAQHMNPGNGIMPRDGQRKIKRRVAAGVAFALIALMCAAGAFAVHHMAGLPWRPLGDSLVETIASAGANRSDDTAIMSQQEAERQYPRQASSIDFNNNGKDDYSDILAGALADAANKPQYDDGYYQGGYPPDERGACTDVVWRAFREAGYDLKAMVDADISADPASYATVAPSPDPNIDFRRTGVLDVFFAKYARRLTDDPADKDQWQAGDIVVFSHTKHIGIISDKRDATGLPYVIHNMGQQQRENDYFAFKKRMSVTGHYRFDASQIPSDVLKAWR
ncbi:DUF1287 domain-containing protein [Bifidobacterium olomucense]|uniref:DUF1287 domain-containing protein n=1 Tax=Bifidobacterium olomucense TaxID=2675324 RepID=A0A7Y0EX33_9BIFI|nr:DUF1287 domain-containing protein [Bifidobacterium sp. DSM 109959]NMM98005.1 hypothetical protein [Bifidobacterium sp. DSM 109959]